MMRIYIIGITILIIAILANAIIVRVGLKSWYDFIELLTNVGTNAFSKISLLDYLWLFVGYPFALGFGYWMGNQLYKLFS